MVFRRNRQFLRLKIPQTEIKRRLKVIRDSENPNSILLLSQQVILKFQSIFFVHVIHTFLNKLLQITRVKIMIENNNFFNHLQLYSLMHTQFSFSKRFLVSGWLKKMSIHLTSTMFRTKHKQTIGTTEKCRATHVPRYLVVPRDFSKILSFVSVLEPTIFFSSQIFDLIFASMDFQL